MFTALWSRTWLLTEVLTATHMIAIIFRWKKAEQDYVIHEDRNKTAETKELGLIWWRMRYWIFKLVKETKLLPFEMKIDCLNLYISIYLQQILIFFPNLKFFWFLQKTLHSGRKKTFLWNNIIWHAFYSIFATFADFEKKIQKTKFWTFWEILLFQSPSMANFLYFGDEIFQIYNCRT